MQVEDPTLSIEEIVALVEKGQDRTEQENKLLDEWSFMIPEAQARIKGKLTREIIRQRSLEQEEPLESIEQKANELARLISLSNHVIIYTGAGISTSAKIPDYRGPNGLWTQIRRTGTFSMTQFHDLTNAEPTYTHMAIKELCRKKIVKHVVSQNCDGLHFRSGIPQQQLSEIHGNMYIEVCPTCEKQYFRQADITEKTRRFRHKTGRKCHTCPEPNNNLIDTIVLYGERSRSKWPMNWERAGKAAKKADLIICMGSSLKTLRRYNCLWPKKTSNQQHQQIPNPMNHQNKNLDQQTKLVIINLQYTPKDKNAVLKINGKCDLVMQLVMNKLNLQVPGYDWTKDRLIEVAVPFTQEELQNLGRNLIFELKQRKQLRQLQQRQEAISKLSPSHQNNTDDSQLLQPSESLSKSPSLFVSEMQDDPNKKSLRMKIRAINATNSPSPDNNDNLSASAKATATSKSSINEVASLKKLDGQTFNAHHVNHQDDNNTTEDSNLITGIKREIVVDDDGDVDDDDDDQMEVERQFALPGWLGQGIGNNSRASSYRRKRHGNKGRKNPRNCNTGVNTNSKESIELASSSSTNDSTTTSSTTFSSGSNAVITTPSGIAPN